MQLLLPWLRDGILHNRALDAAVLSDALAESPGPFPRHKAPLPANARGSPRRAGGADVTARPSGMNHAGNRELFMGRGKHKPVGGPCSRRE